MRKFTLVLVTLFVLVIPSFATVISPPASEPDSATVRELIKDFNNLSRKERNSRWKAVKKEIKAYKAARKRGEDISTNTIVLVILAILLPPLAVYLHQGEINAKFWISLLLLFLVLVTPLLWIVPVAYALLVILAGI